MILQTMFPPNPQLRSLVEMMDEFKTPDKVQHLVREQMLSGAEVAFFFVQSEYATLDLDRIVGRDVNLRHFAALVRCHVATVIRKLEEGDEAELRRAQRQ